MSEIIHTMGRDWSWPEADKRLWRFAHQWECLEKVLEVVPGRGTAIQAGGAMGIWPAYLAKHFDKVLTFEPDPENAEHLVFNTIFYPQISVFHAALGAKPGKCNLKLYNPENLGTWYTEPEPEGDTVVLTIDGLLKDDPVDFIQLDIEGREAEALRGASNTIERWNPVIMIEENVKSTRNADFPVDTWGDARELLQELGYSEIQSHARDTVWAR
jgi:FkbM family methyltransferase